MEFPCIVTEAEEAAAEEVEAAKENFRFRGEPSAT